MTNKSNTDLHADARDALATINALARNCDCPDPLPRTRLCIHSHAATALRDLLIDRDMTPHRNPNDPLDDLLNPPAHIYDFMRALLLTIDAAPYFTDALSQLALDNSLCPMHFCDYAICFDDDDAECAAIRACFPSHDT